MTIEIQPAEPWQETDISYLLERAKSEPGSANWSQMGGKKTSTGLWFCERFAPNIGVQNPKVLIITTRSGKGTYFQLAPGLLPNWTIFNVSTQKIKVYIAGAEINLGLETLGDEFGMPVLVVTHYDVFTRCNRGVPETDKEGYPKVDDNGAIIFKPLTQGDYLSEINWDVVIVDEAHRIKNRKGKWVKNIKKLKSRHRHIMTGTGFINRPDEIWSLFNFLDRRKYNNYWQFVADYCDYDFDDETGYKKITGVKPEKLQEFRELVRSFGPRRELQEVMPHLNQPIYVRREVELSASQRKFYNALVSELEAETKKGRALNTPTVLSLLQRLRQVCTSELEVVADYYDEKEERRVIQVEHTEGSSKLDAVMDILDELEWDEDSKQQVVIFSCFKGPLKLLEKRLEDAEIPYIHMEASDNDQERYHKWAELWPQKKHRVFMSTVALGGESINLTSAQYLIFLDRSWSPKDNNQAVGRVYRPGQEGQPVVINIEAENTTDQYVEDKVLTKESWFRAIFGRDPNGG